MAPRENSVGRRRTPPRTSASRVLAVCCGRQLDRGGFDEYWCVVDDEVWLILHFADCAAGVAGPKAAGDKLRKHVPGYAKGKLDFAVLAGKVDKAVERAKALGAGNRPVTCGVWSKSFGSTEFKVWHLGRLL